MGVPIAINNNKRKRDYSKRKGRDAKDLRDFLSPEDDEHAYIASGSDSYEESDSDNDSTSSADSDSKKAKADSESEPDIKAELAALVVEDEKKVPQEEKKSAKSKPKAKKGNSAARKKNRNGDKTPVTDRLRARLKKINYRVPHESSEDEEGDGQPTSKRARTGQKQKTRQAPVLSPDSSPGPERVGYGPVSEDDEEVPLPKKENRAETEKLAAKKIKNGPAPAAS